MDFYFWFFHPGLKIAKTGTTGGYEPGVKTPSPSGVKTPSPPVVVIY